MLDSGGFHVCLTGFEPAPGHIEQTLCFSGFSGESITGCKNREKCRSLYAVYSPANTRMARSASFSMACWAVRARSCQKVTSWVLSIS